MTRVEFIAALRAKLSMLSADEREDAIQFYQEYFDEAGPENEQAVIDELGSPDAVAEKILSGEGKIVQRGWQSGAHDQAAARKSPSGKDSTGKVLLWVLIAVLTSPFWGTALAMLVCMLAAMLLMLLAAVLMVAAVLVTSLVSLGVGIYMIPGDPLNGLMVLSIGLIGLGCMLILAPLLMLLFKKGFPAIGRGCKKLWGWGKKNWKSAWEKIKNIG